MGDSVDQILAQYNSPPKTATPAPQDAVDRVLEEHGLTNNVVTHDEKNQALLSGISDAPSKLSGGLLPSGAAMRSFGQTVLFPNDPNRQVNQQLASQGIKIDEPGWNDFQAQKAIEQAKIDSQKVRAPEDYATGMVGEGGLMVGAGAAANAGLVGSAVKGLLPYAQKALLPAGLAVGYHYLGKLGKGKSAD